MKRILVAEDNRNQREFLVEYLRKKGYGVVDAWDGKEALEFFDREGNIDLVHTDIEMPYIDGYELIQKLSERGYKGPIIVWSGARELEKIEYDGPVKHLRKPVSLDDVFSIVKELIGDP